MPDSDKSDDDEIPDESNIQIYLRIRPVTEPSDCIQIVDDENHVRFDVPRKLNQG